MRAHTAIWLVLALNTGLLVYLTWRNHMDRAQQAAMAENLVAIFTSLKDQLDKVVQEIKDSLPDDAPANARLDSALEKLAALGVGFGSAIQVADDAHPDKTGEPPAPAPAPSLPPQDDAFVAVGDTRFSDGQAQTEESKAAAVAAWNDAHPDGPVAS